MYSLLTSRHFLNSRNVLEGKARLLREQGKGKRPNKSCSLGNDEIEQLWQSGQFGYHSATLWWLFNFHFGLRGRQKHHSMKIKNFTFKKHDGFTCVTFSEGITKTRQSGLREKYRVQIPKLFETRNDRCPVKMFRTYLAKRPADLRTSGPFYLATIYNPSCAIWFKRSPMGVHTINNIMKNVISKSPLKTSKHITNHSARKTLVKRLKQNNVAKSKIISITGHSTEAGLDPYDGGDEKQQQAISNAIDNCIIKPFLHRQHFIPPNDPRILNPTFSFFQQADFKQNILPLNSPINMYNCNVKVYQNAPTISIAPVEKDQHEPLKKCRRVIYSQEV